MILLCLRYPVNFRIILCSSPLPQNNFPRKEYYSIIKRNKHWYSYTWINLKVITLHEIRQTKKKKERERRVYAIWFYLCKLQEIPTNIEWKKADSGFLGGAVLWGERQIANGHREILGGSEYVHYLDCDVKIFHICENLPSLNICSLLYVYQLYLNKTLF